MRNRKYS